MRFAWGGRVGREERDGTKELRGGLRWVEGAFRDRDRIPPIFILD